MYCIYVKCVLCIDNWTENLNEFFRWRVVAQGILGGFLLLSIFEAVSRFFGFTVLSHAMAS